MSLASASSLAGLRILVVEDEYFLAADVSDALRREGAEVIGPVGAADAAMARASQEDRIDAALLDINLRGEQVFEVADVLAARGVPLVFTTGYEAAIMPPRYRDSPRCQKPFETTELSALIPGLIASAKRPGRKPEPAQP